jgi:uncharacterized RDD family membrane protein YckC
MDQPSRPEDATMAVPPPPPPPPVATPAELPAPYPPPAPWAVPPEPLGPAPGVRFASHGGRLLAYVVDVILVSVLVTVVTIALGIVVGALAIAGADALAALGGLLILIALLAVSLGYFPWFWVKGGATPGMRIFRLKVVRDRDGGPLGWGEAFLRLFGFWVSSLVFYLGFAWILIDKRRRGWHDIIAGTVMVQPE